jgi:hypothetical protein
MAHVAFDTLKLAQRLESAGLPPKQAQEMASAFSDTIGETAVSREYLDLRLAELKAEILKWMLSTVGIQTIVIIGAIAALVRLVR